MRISQILAAKDKTGIISVTPNNTIADAAAILSELRIGSLIVSNDDGKTLVGILSERDIVRRLGVDGVGVMVQKVSELMTSKVQTVTSDTDAEAALKIMSKGRFRHLPVMDDNTLTGLISIGDVVSARLREIERENSALNDMIAGTIS